MKHMKSNKLIAIALIVLAVMSSTAFAADDAGGIQFDDYEWPVGLMEEHVQLFGMDFPIYSAYKYDGDGAILSVTYSTQEDVNAIRDHYMKTVGMAQETGTNNDGSLSLTGEAGGQRVDIKNYYSDVSNIISVDMAYDGPASDGIKEGLMAAFPQDAIDADEAIAAFTSGPSDSGYVLYSTDMYAADSYPDIPIFSRAYGYEGSLDDLNADIAALAGVYTEDGQSVIEEGRALVKSNGYLFTISSMENDEGVFAVVTVQEMPPG